MKIEFYSILKIRVLIIMLLVWFCAGVAMSCDIPVFRYALEQWFPDSYAIEVLYPKDLSDTEKDAMALLDQYGGEGLECANIKVRSVLITPRSLSSDRGTLFKHALLTLRYPRSVGPIIWTGPLNSQSVEQLLRSPVRSEIVKRIKGGDSVVWVLVEGSDAEQNREALAMLDTSLDSLEKDIKLPVTFAARSSLKIRFSSILLSKKDSDEVFFTSMLLRYNQDWRGIKEPMAFAVFGQGRVMLPVIGEDIGMAKIREVSEFLCDECSCEAKQGNPGFDLLITADWGGDKSRESYTEIMLPPLAGITSPVITTNLPVENTATVMPISKASRNKRFLFGLLVFTGLLVGAVLGGTIWIQSCRSM